MLPIFLSSYQPVMFGTLNYCNNFSYKTLNPNTCYYRSWETISVLAFTKRIQALNLSQRKKNRKAELRHSADNSVPFINIERESLMIITNKITFLRTSYCAVAVCVHYQHVPSLNLFSLLMWKWHFRLIYYEKLCYLYS